MLSALSSTIWLRFFGRKTLTIVGQFGMAVSCAIIVVSIFIEVAELEITLVMVYTCFFEISLGSVLWIYLAEIQTEKGMSLAVFLNWVVVIAVIFATAPMIEWSDKITFIIYTVTNLLGGVFVIFFM